MMDYSYIDEMKKSYPRTTFPVTQTQVQTFELFARNSALDERFVSKSERISALNIEIEKTQKLRNKAKEVSGAWRRHANSEYTLKKQEYEGLPYLRYAKIEEFVSSRIKKDWGQAQDFSVRMANVASTLFDKLGEAEARLHMAATIEEKGASGETQVETYLKRNLNCRILASVILPSAIVSEDMPKTAETDLLVISSYGVFVCEIKNYGKSGQLLEILASGEFIKKDRSGRALERMGFPFKQNSRHCDAVRKVLTDNGLSDVPIYPVVILANPDVIVTNNSNYWVMDMYRFCEAMKAGFNGKKVSAGLQHKVYETIQANRMGERKFPIPCVQDNLAETLDEMSKKLDEARRSEWKKAVLQWKETVERGWLSQNQDVVRYAKLRKSLMGYESFLLTMGIVMVEVYFLAIVVDLLRLSGGYSIPSILFQSMRGYNSLAVVFGVGCIVAWLFRNFRTNSPKGYHDIGYDGNFVSSVAKTVARKIFLAFIWPNLCILWLLF